MSISTTLTALAAGTYSQWSVVGSRPSCIQSNDGDTSIVHIVSDGSTYRDFYTVTGVPSWLSGVTTHTVYGVLRETLSSGNHSGWFGVRIAAADYTGAATGSMTSSWVTYSAADIGSAAITRANLLSAEFGVEDQRPAGNEWRCTYLYWSITYDPYSFAAAAQIFSLLPPLLGAVRTLCAREWTEIRRLIATPGSLRGVGPHTMDDHAWLRIVGAAREDRARVFVY